MLAKMVIIYLKKFRVANLEALTQTMEETKAHQDAVRKQKGKEEYKVFVVLLAEKYAGGIYDWHGKKNFCLVEKTLFFEWLRMKELPSFPCALTCQKDVRVCLIGKAFVYLETIRNLQNRSLPKAISILYN